MTTRQALLIAAAALAAVIAGCSSGGAPPSAPPADDARMLEIGPLLVRPASAAGFRTVSLSGYHGACSFVGLYGSQIDYLASQALLDRIVFSSNRDSFYDIWVCNLDGSGATQITNNGATEFHPAWSPDGGRIAFQRSWPAQDPEIMTVNADGATVRALTDNTDYDECPTWSPDGRAIAFHANPGGNVDIFRMYDDGEGVVNLTNAVGVDAYPHWSSGALSQIVFTSTRDGGSPEVYVMGPDGELPTRLTNDAFPDYSPAWHPTGSMIAWETVRGPDSEIALMQSTGTSQRVFTNHPTHDRRPAWSSDARYVAFDSERSGNPDIWLQEAAPPYRAYRVTKSTAADTAPHLGSPTRQTERVLIGPGGSDWGGYDPVWTSAYAGIVAFSQLGYRNFVRIGVRSSDADTIQMSALPDSGFDLAAVLVEAAEIVNLREDAGRGSEPTAWDLDPLNAGGVVLYFSTDTGRIVSALAVRDSVYPSRSGGAVCTQSIEGGRLVATGDFCAVFDAQGRNLAPGGATRVRLGEAGGAIEVD